MAVLSTSSLKTPQDAEQVQTDLQKMIDWTKAWQMKNEKCAVLRCTHSLSPIQHGYTLSGHDIAIKKLYTYIPQCRNRQHHDVVVSYTNVQSLLYHR